MSQWHEAVFAMWLTSTSGVCWCLCGSRWRHTDQPARRWGWCRRPWSCRWRTPTWWPPYLMTGSEIRSTPMWSFQILTARLKVWKHLTYNQNQKIYISLTGEINLIFRLNLGLDCGDPRLVGPEGPAPGPDCVVCLGSGLGTVCLGLVCPDPGVVNPNCPEREK